MNNETLNATWQYKSGAKHIGNGEWVDLAVVFDEDRRVYTVTLAYIYLADTAETLQKRILTSKDNWSAKTTSASVDLMERDVAVAFTGARSVFQELLFTMFSDEDPVELQELADEVTFAIRLALLTTSTTIIGKNVSDLGRHELFISSFESASEAKKQEILEEFLVDFPPDNDPPRHTSDIGTPILQNLADVIRTYPSGERLSALKLVSKSLRWESHVTQAVESEHQFYLTEKATGRHGDSKAGARCSSVLISQNLTKSHTHASEARIRMEEESTLRLRGRVGVLNEQLLEIQNTRKYGPWSLFCTHMKETGALAKMEGSAVTDFLSEKYNQLGVKQYWEGVSKAVREQELEGAAQEINERFDRAWEDPGVSLGGKLENERFIPPKFAKMVEDYHVNLKEAVKQNWNDHLAIRNWKGQTEFHMMTDRSRSLRPADIPSFTTITHGPPLVTRRAIWLAKSDGGVLVRQKEEEKKTDPSAGGSEAAATTSAMTAGLKTCPTPHERRTHLVVHLEALQEPFDPRHVDGQEEFVLITMTWSRTYSWVGRKLFAASLYAAVPSVAKSSARDIANSPARYVTLGDFTDPISPIAPSPVRNWSRSADRPRNHIHFLRSLSPY